MNVMSRKLTPFFATQSDLAAITREVMAAQPVDFLLSGLFLEPRLVVLTGIDGLSPFGTYLVANHGASASFRAVPQRSGGTMYAVDQINNSHTLALHTGGMYTGQQLISGQIGTIGNSKQADDLYSLFSRIIRKRFDKVKSFYIGPESAGLLDNGVRLSVTSKSPQRYDLAR